MQYCLKNDQGEVVSGVRVPKKPEYGTGKFDDNGEELINWEGFRTEYADQHGFDIREINENGEYWEDISLPRGTVIIRYGPESGKYTAPLGASYDELALPYKRSTVEFHKYIVKSLTFTVRAAKVLKGIVAPMFDSNGGAVQFYHLERNISELLKRRILRRIL